MSELKICGKSYMSLTLSNGSVIDCLVLSSTKEKVVIYPTEHFLDSYDKNDDSIRIEIGREKIVDAKKRDTYELLLMIDKNDINLSRAIEEVLDEEGKCCG